jgi:hypothetical protein
VTLNPFSLFADCPRSVLRFSTGERVQQELVLPQALATHQEMESGPSLPDGQDHPIASNLLKILAKAKRYLAGFVPVVLTRIRVLIDAGSINVEKFVNDRAVGDGRKVSDLRICL